MTTESPMMTSKMMVTPINNKGVIVIFSLITMTPLLFIGVTIILLVIIGLSVVINCYKVANSNPVKYLKDE